MSKHHIFEEKNAGTYLPELGLDAKIDELPWAWSSEMVEVTRFSQLPSEYYNHDLGYYPKRILLIETGEEYSNR